MLLNPNNRKKVRIIWSVICILVIISMTLLYSASLFMG